MSRIERLKIISSELNEVYSKAREHLISQGYEEPDYVVTPGGQYILLDALITLAKLEIVLAEHEAYEKFISGG